MARKKLYTFPAQEKEMIALGARIRDARLRRKFTMASVCERVNISRPTLSGVEDGDPSVSLGIYVSVLSVLGLQEDLSLIAKEDKLGRLLQDESLPRRKRAPNAIKREEAGTTQ